MKFKIRSIVLLMSLFTLTLVTAGQASAQNRFRPVADSGVITLGPNQILRVSVAAGDVTGDDRIRVRFQQIGYEPCQASPKLCIVSQTTTNPIMLAANESAIVDAADYVVWRTIVLSDSRNVKVTGVVFDTSTQRVVTQIIMANTEGGIL